jgi:hypothetical protein
MAWRFKKTDRLARSLHHQDCLLQQIADIHVQVLGEDHPATAIALSELMVHYADEGDRVTTRALQERILRSMEHTLGPDDPRVRSACKTYDLLASEPEQSGLSQATPPVSRAIPA